MGRVDHLRKKRRIDLAKPDHACANDPLIVYEEGYELLLTAADLHGTSSKEHLWAENPLRVGTATTRPEGVEGLDRNT